MTEAAAGSLKELSDTASTSRVLNLSRVNTQFKHDEAYKERPFFKDALLNRAIIVKQRLRRNETYLLPRSQPVATKIILPFDASLLQSGGQSIFVGQTGFDQVMRDLLGPSTYATRQDLDLLRLIETLPSLDPFLLKEHLARRQLHPADCYFDISPADIAAMRAFVKNQIGALISLAFGSSAGGSNSNAVTRLVDALMSNDESDRLEPLGLTLGLTGQAFKDGVFSWKGFLYYKWQFNEIAAKLNRVLSELDLVRFNDNPSPDKLEVIDRQQAKLKKSIRSAARECTTILTLYDDAFEDLLHRSNAAPFRKFLLQAPTLFVTLGSSMAGIAHIKSNWTHRFPDGDRLIMNSADFRTIVDDFQYSLNPEAGIKTNW